MMLLKKMYVLLVEIHQIEVIVVMNIIQRIEEKNGVLKIW